jgi:2-amino-4-hydroxy-6-hydroxymethyldihydropteridine diphosphokinase
MEVDVYFSLGSNIGDRLATLQRAVELIHDGVGKVVKTSKVYESDPVGFEADTTFYNIAVKCITRLSAEETLNVCSRIEQELGRERKSIDGYSSRTLDIDIIFFGKQLSDNSALQIPHPRYNKRTFVLYPLNDLDEELIDPKTFTPIKEYLGQRLDTGGIKAINSSINLNF